MAKIENKSLYIGITPYEHEGQKYDVLSVTAGYRKGTGFYVNVHPGWRSDFGFGCMFDCSRNPLSDTTWVGVMEAPKNSQKTIDTMHANLCGETAQKIIRLLFDGRKWEVLKLSLKHIAKNSAWATEALLTSLSKSENNNIQQSSNNSEDKTMKLNLSNNNESANAAKQVNNHAIAAAMAPAIEDAVYEEVTPTKKPSPAPSISGEGRGEATLPVVKVITYKTKKGADAPMIVGFGGEDDPRWKPIRETKPKWASASYRTRPDGTKDCYMIFGSKYIEVVRQLADAYNTSDKKAWAKAEDACKAVHEQSCAEGKARWEAKKQEWAEKRSQKAEGRSKVADKSPKTSPVYSVKDVADILTAVLNGGEIPEEIQAAMAA